MPVLYDPVERLLLQPLHVEQAVPFIAVDVVENGIFDPRPQLGRRQSVQLGAVPAMLPDEARGTAVLRLDREADQVVQGEVGKAEPQADPAEGSAAGFVVEDALPTAVTF